MLEQQKHHFEIRESALVSALQGALSGTLATLPMTVAMAAIQRLLPPGQRYELPPRMIVEDISDDLDLGDDLTSNQKTVLTGISHFGYGSVLGMVYGLLARRLHRQGVGQGMAFGLAAWCGGYLGWLPAFGIRASATKEPSERIAMMIAAHLVWGGVTGFVQASQQAENDEAHISGNSSWH